MPDSVRRWTTTIESLHPSIDWRAGGIEIGFFPPVGNIRLAGDGLLLIPSVFVGNIAAHLEDPWPRTLVYPAAAPPPCGANRRPSPNRTR